MRRKIQRKFCRVSGQSLINSPSDPESNSWTQLKNAFRVRRTRHISLDTEEDLNSGQVNVGKSKGNDSSYGFKKGIPKLSSPQQAISSNSDNRRSSLEQPEQRRRAASISTPHRASDVHVDPARSAILFRDARGLPVMDPFLEKHDFQTLQLNEGMIIAKFFSFHKCYDLIPTSAKLVVFDTQILVKKAFFALVYNGVRAAPLWDSKKQKFVGMLTITDFIRILRMYYVSPDLKMNDLETHQLETWRNVLNDIKELISIGPDASLYEAIRILIHNKIHRLPVIDPKTNNVLYILTHKRLLKFLFLYVHDLPKPSFLAKSVFELKIGTYDNIETARYSTPIIEALNKFVGKRISALPIVDDDGKLIDIYAKFDVMNLAAEKTYENLDVTLKVANEYRNEWFEGVHKCKQSDSVFDVMENIVKAEVHRLVVVDDNNKVVGVISLSDLLTFLVLDPCGDSSPNLVKLLMDTSLIESGGSHAHKPVLKSQSETIIQINQQTVV
ncbi:5'-AMP-activated protein kinase subunit gamma-1 [Lepeophtheirus salmonis]|uniref:5'-AMP-activated protein kinase subunit gamma-1 n=1 Tax=Lepeophtheirus salmonis TaxID=72036 RepID=UPI001AEB30C2|nr:5'-AMP-activated protein kinase subunit gamma-1-like [Lepeophtheirus salmonis]